jgi:hypothetical protein
MYALIISIDDDETVTISSSLSKLNDDAFIFMKEYVTRWKDTIDLVEEGKLLREALEANDAESSMDLFNDIVSDTIGYVSLRITKHVHIIADA